MNLDAYLRRIGYDGPRDASLATLSEIARRHAMTIPFENIAVLCTGAPDLEAAAVEAKLVERRRGGYCFEQNGLLLAALRALGFEVMPLSARVRYGLSPDVVTPRSHMVLLVAVDATRMLVDAGFGGLTPTAPLDLDTREPQPTPHETFRVVPGPEGFVVQARFAHDWRDLYGFDLVRQHPVDYAQQNWYTATRPGALFANNLVVARPVPGGRRTLFNRTMTWRAREGEVERSTVPSMEALRDALATHFGVRPGDAELAKAWSVAERGPEHHAMFV